MCLKNYLGKKTLCGCSKLEEGTGVGLSFPLTLNFELPSKRRYIVGAQ